MKKLLLLSFFFFGVFAISQAQTVRYNIINNTIPQWDVTVSDPDIDKVSVPGQSSVQGAFNQDLTVPFAMTATNDIGCSVGAFINGPVGWTVLTPDPCSSQAFRVRYQLIELSQNPFIYQLEIVFTN